MNPIPESHPSLATYFADIDRIIHAARIYDMQELKKMIRFVDDLIQTCLQQIISGMLSNAGARRKIMQLLSIIGHCQIGNHPIIKSQLDKLKNTYEHTFKQPIEKIIHPFKPATNVLSSASIHHYIETILDSQNDPIYSEQPKATPKHGDFTLELKQMLNSNQINSTLSVQEKQAIRAQLLAIQLVKNQKKTMPVQSKSGSKAAQFNRMHQFDRIRLSKQNHIAATA